MTPEGIQTPERHDSGGEFAARVLRVLGEIDPALHNRAHPATADILAYLETEIAAISAAATRPADRA